MVKFAGLATYIIYMRNKSIKICYVLCDMLNGWYLWTIKNPIIKEISEKIKIFYAIIKE